MAGNITRKDRYKGNSNRGVNNTGINFNHRTRLAKPEGFIEGKHHTGLEELLNRKFIVRTNTDDNLQDVSR